MSYHIDQSGKIEQTSLDTIIALSNKEQFALTLPKQIKRIMQKIFRNEGRQSQIIIDREYRNENLIKARMSEFLRILGVKSIPDFEFGLVGKSSPAHILAAKVGNEKVKSNLVITLEEISEVLWPSKKTGYSIISGTEGNLTQDFVPGGRKPSRSLIYKRYHRKR